MAILDPGSPTDIYAVCPSTIGVGEEFSFGLKVLTEPYIVTVAGGVKPTSTAVRFDLSPRGLLYMDNVPPQWAGALTIDGGHGYVGPSEYSFHEQPRGRPIARVGPASFIEPGLKCLTVRDEASGVVAKSNPILVTEEPPAEKLYWGDLHCQTYFSDGLRSPEQLFSFARDEAFLDIFSLADHTGCLTDRQWDYFVAVTNDFNEPGRFATLIGQEWARSEGHRNVYYPGDYGPILRGGDALCNSLPKLYEVAREHDALVIPHHTASALLPSDWALAHDPEVERLVEIYSIWGNSECSEQDGNLRPIHAHGGTHDRGYVVDALRRGFRFGFIGGGDIHDGRPGDDLSNLQHMKEFPDVCKALYRQGIMGVWAKELTREAVWDALWRRHVYATTNVRIILRFHINGSRMGTEIESDGRQQIAIEAHSDVPIARVDVIRNGDTLKRMDPDTLDVTWAVEDAFADRPAWYYARLTRSDGEMAWSSPIWVSQ